MKKVLVATMLVLLFATAAHAEATFSMTGSYWAEGKYWVNYNRIPGTDDPAVAGLGVLPLYKENGYGFYEQDINLFPKIAVGNTSLNMKIAVTDIYWGARDADTDENIKSELQNAGNNNAAATASSDGEEDDNISVERAYITHKFGDKATLEVGLMDGTVWGTTFADDKTGRWRVKLSANTPVGVVGGILEKVEDEGVLFGDEGDDSDNYAIFAVTKAGSVYIKPLIYYVAPDGLIDGSGDGLTRLYLSLAFNGDLGPVSFESELNYNDYNAQAANGVVDVDFSTYGFYFNVWKALGTMTPGVVLAYGSQDADGIAELSANGLAALAGNATLDFDDDFNSTVILGDEYGWGGGDDLKGMTLLKLYVNDIKTGVDPLTLSAYFAYVMSNQDDGDATGVAGNAAAYRSTYKDATAWELSVGAAYKITDNLVYTPYAAYADISYDVNGIEDPDSVYVLANAIEFTF